MAKMLRRLFEDQSGATAIEYALIATLISGAIIIGATTLGSALGAKFSGFADLFPTH